MCLGMSVFMPEHLQWRIIVRRNEHYLLSARSATRPPARCWKKHSPESYCMESDCENPTSPEPLQEDKLFILHNKSVRYKVLEFIGEGSFGKVAKCVNMNTNENTAIKILKNVNDYDDEVEMLEKLRNLDPEKNNLVRFMDSFIVDDMPCIAFECLDRSLWDLMVQREERLTHNEIRPITRQLLVALNALKGIGLLHSDLKVDNVMLVNHQDEPFRVKLIDFGVALPASEVQEGMIVQPYVYQAPEVSLGLPISEAIDMWSLGCLLACLFFCQNIFNGESSYDVMNTICCLLGQPQDHLLDAGKYTHRYFKRKRCTRNSRWRLKTPEEFDDQLQLSEWEFDQIGNLTDAVNKYSNAIEEVEVEDTRAFLNLLQMLLNPDAEMRITPEEALEHSFVTMSHLADYAHRSSYTQAAFELMVVCPACDSDKCHEYLSDFESNSESSDSGEVFSNVDNTSSEESYCMESDCENPTSPEPLQEDKLFILHNKSVRYKVLEFIGEGTFGNVAKFCLITSIASPSHHVPPHRVHALCVLVARLYCCCCRAPPSPPPVSRHRERSRTCRSGDARPRGMHGTQR
uniref:Protein kinase domain-containing protein n=1 Tax=Gasterosteus aculeatus aculeatus TaxID=481459 RepID=A0AAQ4REP9_GASAC